MREIKFRAWDGTKMLAWEVVKKEHLDGLEDETWVWMQFTGLHDKNGVEIYEGDISYIAGTGNCFASFCYGAWHWESKQHIFPFNECEEEIIVIGNIYQNPELLEAK